MKQYLSCFLLCPASVSRTLTVPETSYERNHTAFVFLCLAHFSWPDILNVHPQQSLCQQALPSQGWATFHPRDTLRFAHPFSPQQILRWSPLLHCQRCCYECGAWISLGRLCFQSFQVLYSEKELLDHTALLQASEEPPHHFHSRCSILRATNGARFPTSSPTLAAFLLHGSRHHNRCEAVSYCGFNLHLSHDE